MGKYYKDETFCDNCQAETPHNCWTAEHERDCSYDWEECAVCKWKKYGMTGEYEPPFEEDLK